MEATTITERDRDMIGGAVHRSTLPLFPTDDGWPYPDLADVEPCADDDVDLDVLELQADPHAFADLTELEYVVVARRYGLEGPPWSMKAIARDLACTRAEARDVLGAALSKLRDRFTAP